MTIAMILAGGNGRRMGGDIPKQFIKVQGKPIIVHTLEKFEMRSDIDAIQIICIESHKDYVADLAKQYGIRKVRWIETGGKTFLHSIQNGVYPLSHICAPDDIITIHMSVAPFIEADIIDDALAICRRFGNSISVNPCLLCMGEYTTPEYTEKSVLRETLVGLNTPQTFYYKQLLDAYHWADERGITDELEPHLTSLMYSMGVRLYFSKGSQYNFKITTKEDLTLFEGYLYAKQKNSFLLDTQTGLNDK